MILFLMILSMILDLGVECFGVQVFLTPTVVTTRRGSQVNFSLASSYWEAFGLVTSQLTPHSFPHPSLTVAFQTKHKALKQTGRPKGHFNVVVAILLLLLVPFVGVVGMSIIKECVRTRIHNECMSACHLLYQPLLIQQVSTFTALHIHAPACASVEASGFSWNAPSGRCEPPRVAPSATPGAATTPMVSCSMAVSSPRFFLGFQDVLLS